MAKLIDLQIEISEDGETIKVKVNGTEGPECLDVLSFLDNIDSFVVEDTVSTDDMQTKDVQTGGTQSVKGK
jgi:hypothetical protein